MVDANPSFLALIVDADPDAWRIRGNTCLEGQINYQEMVSAVILFCNSYTLMHRQNRLLVLASRPSGSVVIYPRRTVAEGEDSSSDINDEFVPLGHALPGILSAGLLKAVEPDPSSSSSSSSSSALGGQSISQSFSKALCGKESTTPTCVLADFFIHYILVLHSNLQIHKHLY